MAFLGNIFWFVLGGWLLFIFYTLAAIVFFPVFVPLWRLAIYSAWPMGRSVISQSKLTKYKEITGKSIELGEVESKIKGFSSILNVLWLLTFGWVLALIHFFSALFNLVFFFLIFTIPNIMGNWKLMGVALMPFNKKIVPNTVLKEITDTIAKDKLGI